MFKKFAMTTAATLLASTATAEELIYGDLSFDFRNYETGGAEANGLNLAADVEYKLGQWLVDGLLNYTTIDFEDVSEAEATAFGLGAGYFLSPQALIGAGFLLFDDDTSNTNVLEAYGQFVTSDFGIGIAAGGGTGDNDDIFYTAVGNYTGINGVKLGVGLLTLDDAGNSQTNYRIAGDYDLGPIEARAYYLSTEDVNGGLFGMRGAYQFNGGFRASASFETTSGDDLGDANAFNVGAGYAFSPTTSIDAKLGQITGDDFEDVDTYAIVINFETGSRTRLDRELLQDYAEDAREGLLNFVNFQ